MNDNVRKSTRANSEIGVSVCIWARNVNAYIIGIMFSLILNFSEHIIFYKVFGNPSEVTQLLSHFLFGMSRLFLNSNWVFSDAFHNLIFILMRDISKCSYTDNMNTIRVCNFSIKLEIFQKMLSKVRFWTEIEDTTTR